jgi:hypothetical protein
MCPNLYQIDYDSELDIFTVHNRKKNVYYTVCIDVEKGGMTCNRCKAIEVYGQGFICKHKKLVGKFMATPEYKYLYNLTRKREKEKKLA